MLYFSNVIYKITADFSQSQNQPHLLTVIFCTQKGRINHWKCLVGQNGKLYIVVSPQILAAVGGCNFQ